MKTIPEKLENQLQLALNNLNLASLLCRHLKDYNPKGEIPMPTEVVIHGPSDYAYIPGKSCGFVTTPVIHNAILDVRRILEFFKIYHDKKTSSFENFTHSKYADDFSITDLGLNPVTPDQLATLSFSVIGRNPFGALEQLLNYANKQMAHFSKNSDLPELECILDGTAIIKEAVLVFVYDNLKIDRPKLQPTDLKKTTS